MAAVLFDFTLLSFDFGLIRVDLALLLRLFNLLALELIANQSHGAETQGAANGSADSRRTDGGANNPANCGFSESADAGAFFARGEVAASKAED